ncbi:hypothetical protein N9K40_03940 [Candidatus Pelagibacter sp.]|nr:hypothetical protein [Candidatus Pelagibacter sp.]
MNVSKNILIFSFLISKISEDMSIKIGIKTKIMYLSVRMGVFK